MTPGTLVTVTIGEHTYSGRLWSYNADGRCFVELRDPLKTPVWVMPEQISNVEPTATDSQYVDAGQHNAMMGGQG